MNNNQKKEKLEKLKNMKNVLNRTKYALLIAAVLTANKANVNAGDVNAVAPGGAGIVNYEAGSPYVDTVCGVVDNLPYSVKAMLINDKYTVNVVNHPDDIETIVYGSYGDQGVDGICLALIGDGRTKWGSIYVEANLPYALQTYNIFAPEYVQKYGAEAVLRRRVVSVTIHEIGHAVYYHEISKVPNYDQMLTDIYLNEVNGFNQTAFHKEIAYSADTTYDQREYFAEAFACYYLYPTELATKCPRTYQFVQNNLILLNQEFPAPQKGDVKTLEK